MPMLFAFIFMSVCQGSITLRALSLGELNTYHTEAMTHLLANSLISILFKARHGRQKKNIDFFMQ